MRVGELDIVEELKELATQLESVFLRKRLASSVIWWMPYLSGVEEGLGAGNFYEQGPKPLASLQPRNILNLINLHEEVNLPDDFSIKVTDRVALKATDHEAWVLKPLIDALPDLPDRPSSFHLIHIPLACLENMNDQTLLQHAGVWLACRNWPRIGDKVTDVVNCYLSEVARCVLATAVQHLRAQEERHKYLLPAVKRLLEGLNRVQPSIQELHLRELGPPSAILERYDKTELFERECFRRPDCKFDHNWKLEDLKDPILQLIFRNQLASVFSAYLAAPQLVRPYQQLLDDSPLDIFNEASVRVNDFETLRVGV